MYVNPSRYLEADVVVAGSGISGMVAAIEAASLGCQTILVEKDSNVGGNSRWAGRFDLVAYDYEQVRCTDPDGDPVLQKVLVTRFHDDVRWLCDLGVELEELEPSVFYYKPNQGEGGIRTFKNLRAVYTDQGGDLRVATALRRLIQTPPQGISRVEVQQGGETFQIWCRSVVLATGSFSRNRELKLRYLGAFGDRTGYCGTEYHDGDGIKAALDLGAAVSSGVSIGSGGCIYPPPFRAPEGWFEVGVSGNPTSEPVPPGVQRLMIRPPCRGSEAVVLVNAWGRRYVDESASYTTIGWKTSLQPEGLGFCIFDRQTRNLFAAQVDAATRCGATLMTAQDPPSLAEQLSQYRELGCDGVDRAALVATLHAYNAAAVAGESSVLEPPRRRNARPLVGTLYAAPVIQGVVDMAGGLLIDEEARVLDNERRPIPGLYAAGADAGRPFSLEHGGLAHGLIFGRVAGSSAARHAFGGRTT